jgi:hypothetical protein
LTDALASEASVARAAESSIASDLIANINNLQSDLSEEIFRATDAEAALGVALGVADHRNVAINNSAISSQNYGFGKFVWASGGLYINGPTGWFKITTTAV